MYAFPDSRILVYYFVNTYLRRYIFKDLGRLEDVEIDFAKSVPLIQGWMDIVAYRDES